MIYHKTTMQPDGSWKTEETEEPEPVGDPHFDRVKALAEENPGKIVVGARKTKKGKKPDVEIVKLLDNL